MPAGLSDRLPPDLVRAPLAIQIAIQNSMANESPTAGSGSPAPQPSAALSPAERTRLAQCFQHGTQSVAKNIDYAVEMFAVCVAGDPANAIYLQNLLGALRVKHAGKNLAQPGNGGR